MNRKVIALAALAVVATAQPAHAQMKRLLSYGTELADAKTTYEGEKFAVFVHPKEDVILIQGKLSKAIGRGLVSGATLGIASPMVPYKAWRDAAAQFIAPLNCKTGDIVVLDPKTSVEVSYSCPEGVDLRAIVLEQRSPLRKGEPLQPPTITPAPLSAG